MRVIVCVQVWVHQAQTEDDLLTFMDLPQHLRAEVAWRENKEMMNRIHTFKVLAGFPVHVPSITTACIAYGARGC